MPPLSLSADQARRVILAAQGLLGAPDRRGGVPALLARLGAVQLDTISTLARSHELVPYARLGAIGRDAVERAYWPVTGPATTFEYWSHAACVLPLELWPVFAFRRRAFRERGIRWHEFSQRACDEVLARLRSDGPLTATGLGGAKTAGQGWWSWSETKIAVEWLLDIGEVVCVRRTGWRRVYDLPERAVPKELLTQELTDAECVARLIRIAASALGVATRADLIDYHRLARSSAAMARHIDAAIEAAGLVPVQVAGWTTGSGRRTPPAFADPAAVAAPPRGRHRTTLLSPFDSLIWDRRRTARAFGLDHRLEAYVPAPKRVHGYYAMPLLAGGVLIGRVDPARDGRTLVAKAVTMEPGPGTAGGRHLRTAPAAVSSALWSAARWVGCDAVRVERTQPAELAPEIRAALREAEARG